MRVLRWEVRAGDPKALGGGRGSCGEGVPSSATCCGRGPEAAPRRQAGQARSPAPCGGTNVVLHKICGDLLQPQQKLTQTSDSDLRGGTGKPRGPPGPQHRPQGRGLRVPQTPQPRRPPRAGLREEEGGGPAAHSRLPAGAGWGRERPHPAGAVPGCEVTPPHLTPVQTPKRESHVSCAHRHPKAPRPLLCGTSAHRHPPRPPAASCRLRPPPASRPGLGLWAQPSRL